MTTKFDLTRLETMIEGESETLVLLSPASVAACLLALNDRAIYPGAWLDAGAPISPARWDAAAAIIDRANRELLTELTEIDGGAA